MIRDEKPEKIESGIPGVELCPRCGKMTCFVLPRFKWYPEDELLVAEYSCPKCKIEESRMKGSKT
jgi:hypothetical protein